MSKIVNIIAKAIDEARMGADIDQVKEILIELDKVHVKVWRENGSVVLPTYSKRGDACLDIYVHDVEYKDDGRVVYHTGLYFALPEDYEMVIRPRSSMTKTISIMQNSPGTLDAGYRGELMVVHRYLNSPHYPTREFEIGERIAQIIVRRRENVIWDEVKTKEELGETDRGDGGFGSTGK